MSPHKILIYKVKNSKSTMEKPCRHCLDRVIKVNVIAVSHVDMCLLT